MTQPPNDMLGYFQETPAVRIEVPGVLRVVIEIVIWSVVGVVALAVVSGCLAAGLGPVFGWLSPLVVVFLFFLGLQITRVVRRRRGLLALSYVEQAVRLNLPLPRMLQAAERSESRRLAWRLERVRYRLAQGFPVGQALSDGVPEISTRTVAAVSASEGVGRLREGLRRVLDEERAAAARTIGRVDVYRTYPMLMILAIMAMISLISIFVLPKYEQIFKDFGMRLPPITIHTIRTAGQLAPVLLIVSGIVVLVWVGGLFWEAAHPRSLRAALSIGLLDRLRWYSPLWHAMHRDEGLAQVCALMADALAAGMPASRALAEASWLRINAVLRARIRDWAARINAGDALAEGAASAGLPKLVSSMLGTARGADGARDVFQFLARYYRSRFSRAALLLEAAVAPVTVLIFAVIVACVALSLFLPMMSLIDTLTVHWGVM
jgi:type IV pilus assembly protein PilC